MITLQDYCEIHTYLNFHQAPAHGKDFWRSTAVTGTRGFPAFPPGTLFRDGGGRPRGVAMGRIFWSNFVDPKGKIFRGWLFSPRIWTKGNIHSHRLENTWCSVFTSGLVPVRGERGRFLRSKVLLRDTTGVSWVSDWSGAVYPATTSVQLKLAGRNEGKGEKDPRAIHPTPGWEWVPQSRPKLFPRILAELKMSLISFYDKSSEPHKGRHHITDFKERCKKYLNKIIKTIFLIFKWRIIKF